MNRAVASQRLTFEAITGLGLFGLAVAGVSLAVLRREIRQLSAGASLQLNAIADLKGRLEVQPGPGATFRLRFTERKKGATDGR